MLLAGILEQWPYWNLACLIVDVLMVGNTNLEI